MATYTGIADANGDFKVPFSSLYTSGEKITVTAEKDGVEKSIELFAPSEVAPGPTSGFLKFSGGVVNFPQNIGNVEVIGVDVIRSSSFNATIDGSLWAFATGLTISIPATEVQSEAFRGWTNSTYLNLPSGLEKIFGNAFRGWVRALELTIPDTVIRIEALAFDGWSSGRNLTIGSGVAEMMAYSFRGWTSCEQVILKATIPPAITSDTFPDIPPACIFKVPAASVAAYQEAAHWSAFASRIQAI